MVSNVLWKILIVFSCLVMMTSALPESYQNFSKCYPGKRISHKNIAGQIKMLICAGEKDGVQDWQYTDGSSTLGEEFNPAKDCPEIVDYLPEAKDGFYWISFDNKTKHKLWCDVNTDGGGFTLVGMTDSPVTWTIPTNSTPVDPKGPPHWSSELGDLQILDFRVQISSDNTFEGTKAHWFYRLNQKRQLGNILINDVSTGCSMNNPGIGDIKYVKDVQSGSIITTNFKCSIFGPHTHSNLGWGRMNNCLRNTCQNGYGVIPGFLFEYTEFGSFSYSAVSTSTGMRRNSTAFLGCDNGKCCGCFGPKGGRQNYCGPGCTAINGGTVMKNVFVWFWVRNRMPERLWKRCMEFKMKNSVDTFEKYFIDPRTGTAHKGSCSAQFKRFFNEGTLTVADEDSLEKILNVPGLLSYREDNQQLYVNNGSEWQSLAYEDEIRKLQQEVRNQETRNNNQQSAIQNLQTTNKNQQSAIQNHESTIRILQTKNQNQERIIQTLEKTIETLGNLIKKLEKGLQAFQSCSILRQTRPTADSGTYLVNPIQGVLVSVFCDMTSKNGVGVTVIGHDSESRTFVDGYDPAGSYIKTVKYEISMEQVIAITTQSANCEQFIKYECYHSLIWYSSTKAYYAWWVSRQGSKMNYWGGAAVDSGKCACGMNNSCAGGKKCNCDKNDATWREDSGYLTDKNTLPVTQLRFGDTGIRDGVDERGYHTLGKLRCWG
ncbi:uncharacterized protein LOC114517771 [Dendronephthya gigantea]|uniref:uncharacterized protein LOC114517771 n=1 Tax=Dendronephthya gigantea TaxID=151771 RepID=UPI00106B6AF3|nr:uncharacterized protein LOC114517771 [Dendronephthya gigantea]